MNRSSLCPPVRLFRAAVLLLCCALTLGGASAMAQSASPAYHTQDVAIIVQVRAQDDSGAMQDVTGQLVSAAQTGAAGALALNGGYTFTPTQSISAFATDAAGKAQPNVGVDVGLLSMTGADGGTYQALTLIASADISQGRANLQPDSLLNFALGGVPAFANGQAGDISYSLLQMLPPDSYSTEAGKGRLDVFASRWNAGNYDIAGIAGSDGTMQPAVMVNDPLTINGTAPATAANGAARYDGAAQSGVTGGFGVKDVVSKQSAPNAQPTQSDNPGVQAAQNLINGIGSGLSLGLGGAVQTIQNVVGNLTGKGAQPPSKVYDFNSPCGAAATSAQGHGPAFCFNGKGDAHTMYHDTTGQVGQSRSTFSFAVLVDSAGNITGSGTFETDFSLDIITTAPIAHCQTPLGSPATGQLVISGSYTQPGDGASLGGFTLKLTPTNGTATQMQCSDGVTQHLPYNYWNAWNWIMPIEIPRAVAGIAATTTVDLSQPSVDPEDYATSDYPGTLEVFLSPMSAAK
jgi:hypothetical protein